MLFMFVYHAVFYIIVSRTHS